MVPALTIRHRTPWAHAEGLGHHSLDSSTVHTRGAFSASARTDDSGARRLRTLAGGIEEELLLRLLGRHATSSDQWRSLASEADWDRLLILAGPLMAPHLAHRVSAAGVGELVPPSVRERLLGDRRFGAMLQLQQRAALRAAVSALARAGIATVAVKGVALVEDVYRDATHRLMNDVDLWVADQSLPDAVHALGLVGFEIHTRHQHVARRASPEGEHLGQPLMWRDAPVLLELHAPPASFERLSDARRRLAWERAAPSATFGPALRILRAEDLLLHAALHAARHDFELGLRSLVDVLLIVERWGTSWRWEELASEYRTQHVEVPMYVTLALAHDLLAAAIPDSFFDLLPRPPEVEEICRLAARTVLEPPVQELPPLVRAVARQPTFASRLGFVVRRLTVYHWPHERPPGQPFTSTVAAALRSLQFDLRVNIPKYWWSWWRGLWGDELRRRVDLARERGHIHQLLIEAERMAGNADAAPSEVSRRRRSI